VSWNVWDFAGSWRCLASEPELPRDSGENRAGLRSACARNFRGNLPFYICGIPRGGVDPPIVVGILPTCGSMNNQDIYDQHAEQIGRFFTNKVSAPWDIEDLMHRTFEQLFRRLQREPIRDPEPFLYGIAKNVLFEYWRGVSRHQYDVDIGMQSIADMSSGVSTLIAEGEQQASVLEALRTLRLDYQIVVELHYWEQKSYREIAVSRGISVGTVGTWLRRAKDLLRAELERSVAVISTEPLDPASAIPSEAASPSSFGQGLSSAVSSSSFTKISRSSARPEV